MFNRKYLVILILLIISICAVSSVNAADNLTSTVSSDDVGMEEITAISDENQDTLEVQDEENNAIYSNAPSYGYNIDLKDSYEIDPAKNTKIEYTVGSSMGGAYIYDYKLYAIKGDDLIQLDAKSTSSYLTSQKTMSYTIKAKTFTPGTYILTAVNTDDNKVMDVAALKVKGTAVITSNDLTTYYNSGKTMTAKLTDANNNVVMGVNVKVTFSNSKKTQSKIYTTDKNGVITFATPNEIGTYTVTIASADNHIQTLTVQKTAVIKQAPVNVKAYNVVDYKGFKITLKAKVTSQGKNVNEGKVTFKINGKTYTVNVKNGVATKKIKLKKVKTYKYTVKYNGNANLKASKKVNAKAVLKNRLKIKIVMKKHYTVYSNVLSKTITIKIKTTSGKKVKDGKIKIRSNGKTTYAAVKNGKVKVIVYGLGMQHFKSMKGNTETYKKYIHKTAKIKYIPTSHKYKASSKKVKVTSKFKCPACGKTKTHNHYAVGYYYTHVQVIRVV